MESQINEWPKTKACMITIEKKMPEGEADSKAKAPSKGKPAEGEAPKPVSGQAKFDMIPFMYPGACSSNQRCFI